MFCKAPVYMIRMADRLKMIATISSDGNVVINGQLVINNSVAVESGMVANRLSCWDEQSESVRTRKLLYFDQMNKRNSKAWNKGRIDDISPKALSLRW